MIYINPAGVKWICSEHHLCPAAVVAGDLAARNRRRGRDAEVQPTLGCDTASHVLLQHCSALKGDCKNTNVSCLVYCRSVILRSSQPRLQAWIFFPCLLVQVYPGIRKLSLSCPRWWQSYKTAVAFLGEGLWLKHGPENRAAAVPSLLALPS